MKIFQIMLCLAFIATIVIGEKYLVETTDEEEPGPAPDSGNDGYDGNDENDGIDGNDGNAGKDYRWSSLTKYNKQWSSLTKHKYNKFGPCMEWGLPIESC